MCIRDSRPHLSSFWNCPRHGGAKGTAGALPSTPHFHRAAPTCHPFGTVRATGAPSGLRHTPAQNAAPPPRRPTCHPFGTVRATGAPRGGRGHRPKDRRFTAPPHLSFRWHRKPSAPRGHQGGGSGHRPKHRTSPAPPPLVIPMASETVRAARAPGDSCPPPKTPHLPRAAPTCHPFGTVRATRAPRGQQAHCPRHRTFTAPPPLAVSYTHLTLPTSDLV